MFFDKPEEGIELRAKRLESRAKSKYGYRVLGVGDRGYALYAKRPAQRLRTAD